MHTFQINVLVRFLTSSSYFESHGFIIRKAVSTGSFCKVSLSCIYVSNVAGGRVCSIFTAYINARKTHHTQTAGKNRLLDDEPMRSETCGRRQKSN